MTRDEIIYKLEQMGTEQNIKTYKKHGVKEPLFGVSIANLKKLKKEIKYDSNLALQLWEYGNYDAMILAMLILNPKDINLTLGKKLIENVHNYMTCFYLAQAISESNIAIDFLKLFLNDDKEYYQACAFDILSILLKDKKEVSEEIIEKSLLYIKNNIHQRKNRAKYSMNSSLIAIGVYLDKYTKEVIDISKEVGRVEVDHGDTSCKTPLAYEYIDKSLKRKKK